MNVLFSLVVDTYGQPDNVKQRQTTTRRKSKHLITALEALHGLKEKLMMEGSLSKPNDEKSRSEERGHSMGLPASHPSGMAEMCLVCMLPFSQDQQKLRCSKCKMAYCSKTCQIQDWNQGDHKRACKVRQRTCQEAGKANNKNKKNFSLSVAKCFETRLPAVVLMSQCMGQDPCGCVCLFDFFTTVVPTAEPISIAEFLPPNPHDVFTCSGTNQEEWDHTMFIVKRNHSNQWMTVFALDPDGGCLLKTCRVPFENFLRMADATQHMADAYFCSTPVQQQTTMAKWKKFGVRR